MEGASNQPQKENPPALFIGDIPQQNPPYVKGPLWKDEPTIPHSQSGWTSSKATFWKCYLIPSILFTMPSHIAVLGVVTDSYDLKWTGINLWMASPIIAIIVLSIFLIIGIFRKNKSILYAVLVGVVTNTVTWFLSVYYYIYFEYGSW
jgi:hypothetical protein